MIAPQLDEIARTIASMKSRGRAWAGLDLDQRIYYLRECLQGVAAVAGDWVAEACRIKGTAGQVDLRGEEWLTGPLAVARNIRLLIGALEAEAQPAPVALTRRPGGQHVATIFPANFRERILFNGFSGEVWIAPGHPPSQGAFYREPPGSSRLTVVLGAGSGTGISLMDVLHKLFVEGSVVVLKVHPLLASLGGFFERAFRSLIDDGFLAVMNGDRDAGQLLVNHPLVDAIHLTGSAATFDGIVWGTDPADRARRKKSGTPANPRSITAELGCVTPVLVVPGEWSTRELEFQASHVASMVTHNASHNCSSAQLLVTAGGWSQRTEFLELLRTRLADAAPRRAFYPGAHRRYAAFMERYPGALALSEITDDVVPWTILEGCAPDVDDFCFRNELFCGALAEVRIDTSSPDEFMKLAVGFANERCWGTLSCVIVADDETREEYAGGLDRAVEELQYGVIGINLWSGVVFGLVSPPWGSFPDTSPLDIQSGTGFVHNTFMFDHPQKTVVRAPFRISPKPAWFSDHENLEALGVSLFEHEVNPTIGRLLKVGWAAFKG